MTGQSYTGPPLGLSQRVAMIIDGVCRVVAARSAKERALTPMLVLLWTRLRRMAARFERLAAQVGAGRLPAAPEPSAATRHRTARAPRPRPALRLPRGYAWLLRLAPEAAGYGGQLQHMLGDPEMAALLAAEPRLGRILRPLCRLLAIRPGPDLPAALHRAELRTRKPAPPKPAPSRPRSGGRPADAPDGAISPTVRLAAAVVAELPTALPAPA